MISSGFSCLCASPQHLHFTHSLRTDADWRHGFNPVIDSISPPPSSLIGLEGPLINVK